MVKDHGEEHQVDRSVAQRQGLAAAPAKRHVRPETLAARRGGLALGALAGSTGLARVIGEGITGLVPTNEVAALTFAAAVFTVVLSEAMSNTAATNIAIPIIISIALAAGVNPIIPSVAAALSASVAATLPVSTPPNAIVYASGRVTITDMIKYGILMDVTAVTLVPALVLLIAPYFV